jgi:hypothetical protein
VLSGGSTVVEHSHPPLKVKGSSPFTTTGSKKESKLNSD